MTRLGFRTLIILTRLAALPTVRQVKCGAVIQLNLIIMTQHTLRFSSYSILVLVFILANCATSEIVLTGTKVKTNQGTITISELTTENSDVRTLATLKEELFVEYPDLCWGQKNEGRVQLFMDINEDGKSTNTKITRGIGMGCDIAAHSAMKSVTYNPALDVSGNPIAAIHNVTIIFKH